MSPDDLAFFRARLAALRNALRDQGGFKPDPNREDGIGRPDDDLQPLNEMLQVIASSRNRQRADVLRQVEDALHKIDREPDDYGQCTECDGSIVHGRLKIMPYVELCVRCQDVLEQDRAQHRGRRHLTDYD